MRSPPGRRLPKPALEPMRQFAFVSYLQAVLQSRIQSAMEALIDKKALLDTSSFSPQILQSLQKLQEDSVT